MPNGSVTKPGLSIRVPPTRMRAASASSRAGIRPPLMASSSAAQARPPSRRMIQLPMMLSSTSNAMVHHGPITLPTCRMVQISTSGTTTKAAIIAHFTQPRRRRGASGWITDQPYVDGHARDAR